MSTTTNEIRCLIVDQVPVRLVRTGYNNVLRAAYYGSPDGRWEIVPTVHGWGRGERAWRLRDTTGAHTFCSTEDPHVKMLHTLTAVRALIGSIEQREASGQAR